MNRRCAVVLLLIFESICNFLVYNFVPFYPELKGLFTIILVMYPSYSRKVFDDVILPFMRDYGVFHKIDTCFNFILKVQSLYL